MSSYPDTLAEDGEPLDALVVSNEPTFPGCTVRARPIGVLDTTEETDPDHKILAVPIGDPRFEAIQDLEDLPAHWLKEIENFFGTYKALQEADTQVLGWRGTLAAWEVIESAARAAAARGALTS